MSTSTLTGAPGAPETTGQPAEKSHWARSRWLRLAVYLVGALLVLSTVRVVTGANDINSSGAIAAAIALAAPIALAGLGGLWSERAGIVNIGLEGMMILGTWGGAFFGYHYGPWVGVLGAILLGAIGGAIHALATVVFGVDHIVSGVAINTLGAGAAAYLAARTFTGLPGGGPTQSPGLDPLPTITIGPLADKLGEIEKGGTFLLADVASTLRALVYHLSVLTIIVVLLFFATYWILWRTGFGLRLRSCGESPTAAETLGVNVYRYKFWATVISGGLAGLGGGFLALVASGLYRDGQTGGRGFIGLAAMIFGNWRPGGLAGGAALFGYTDAINLRGGDDVIHAYLLPTAVFLLIWGVWQLWRRKQGKPVTGIVTVVMALLVGAWFWFTSIMPSELTAMTPYIATLLVLAFASQRLRMPAADGLIYRKGEAS
ncbi:MAG: ABC transporter permease [Dermatophilaceae bacterium]